MLTPGKVLVCLIHDERANHMWEVWSSRGLLPDLQLVQDPHSSGFPFAASYAGAFPWCQGGSFVVGI